MPRTLPDSKELTDILKRYRKLLGEVDAWFESCLDAGEDNLACRSGCSSCCKALFDISLLDAWVLREGVEGLPVTIQAKVKARCTPRLSELKRLWPQLNPPYVLNGLPEEEWTDMPEDDQAPCPLLDENGKCMVYASRPMICRLHGLPHIDLSGEDFSGVVCTLHRGDPATVVPGDVLRWSFRKTFAEEVSLLREFVRTLTVGRYAELDTFVPLALLVDYRSIVWQKFEL